MFQEINIILLSKTIRNSYNQLSNVSLYQKFHELVNINILEKLDLKL